MRSVDHFAVASAIVLVAVAPATAPCQNSFQSAESRTQAILASMDKTKHVVKERRGVRREKYRSVRNTPVVKADPREYSGTYEVEDLGMALELRVDAKGGVEGTGYEPLGGDVSVRRTYSLTNGKIEGALLTATKVYANGAHEPFEAVFVNRSVFDSPADAGTTEYGLATVGKDVRLDGATFNKFFYRRR